MDVYDGTNDVRARHAEPQDAVARKNALEAMQENYASDPAHLKRVFGYINVDFTPEEDLGRGILAIHSIDAPVHSDSIAEHMFEHTILVPVLNSEKYTDAYFQKQLSTLDKAVPQYAEDPPSLFCFNPNGGKDAKEWNAELGENGFDGVVKSSQNHGRNVQYYIAVRAGAPLACQQLKRYVAKKNLDFDALQQDEKVGFVRNLARRNALRVAFNVARALKVGISHTPDSLAHCKEEHSVEPNRANAPASHQQANSTLKPLSFAGEECVGVYHGVAPLADVSEACFVYAGPYEGLVKFTLNNQGRGFAMPVDTGLKTPADERTPVKDAVAEQRAQGMTWEQRVDAHHPELHPDAYHAVDDDFLEAMKELGWQQKGLNNRQHLVPVVMKLSNPEMRRK